MIYNSGWSNLIPQELKYTPRLAAQAAQMLEAGESLSATARTLHISRASLRNWAKTDPALNRAFDTFEANKAKAGAEREWVKSYQQVADAIVVAAKDGAADPVKEVLEARETAQETEAQTTPLSPEEARQRRLLEWFNSDWTPHFEAMEERQEQTEIERQRDLQGFWLG